MCPCGTYITSRCILDKEGWNVTTIRDRLNAGPTLGRRLLIVGNPHVTPIDSCWILSPGRERHTDWKTPPWSCSTPSGRWGARNKDERSNPQESTPDGPSTSTQRPLPTQKWQRHFEFRRSSSASFNPLTAKLINLNFHPLEVVSRWRDPQLQVSENYSDLTNWRSTVFKYCWLVSHFIFNMFKRWCLMCW